MIFNILTVTGVTEDQIQADEFLTRYLAASPCEFIIGTAETEVDRQIERWVVLSQLVQTYIFYEMQVLIKIYFSTTYMCGFRKSNPCVITSYVLQSC